VRLLPPAKLWHLSVCLSVCLYVCNTITFESLDVESPLFGLRVRLKRMRFKFVYDGDGVKVKVKVTAAKKALNTLFPQCKISIGNNSGSVEDSAVKFACSMGFSAMSYPMVWPPFLSRHRK